MNINKLSTSSLAVLILAAIAAFTSLSILIWEHARPYGIAAFTLFALFFAYRLWQNMGSSDLLTTEQWQAKHKAERDAFLLRHSDSSPDANNTVHGTEDIDIALPNT